MFKLESYITPLILSYVDKYIKNFRAEDSQVSLWGGDVSFNNLDLRLEVLENELQLPFTFVSGHIHELLIHVPWTKITSEPITVTINTIECILKLKGLESVATSANLAEKKKKMLKHNVEPPPTYLQSVINKIVGNIRIYCNNLILKYVEEDIVLSMNVKLLTFESANSKWEPSYTDLSHGEVTLRKLVMVNDLTICLDKRNASGKIEVYQEPILYRCSMAIRFYRNYFAPLIHKTSTTRINMYCTNMEFSMNEQQVPMVMRIITLIMALIRHDFEEEPEQRSDISALCLDDITEDKLTWASWAWSIVPSFFPVVWDSEDKQDVALQGHTIDFGFYVDNISLSFKVSECSSDRGYYQQKKIKYWPVLNLSLQGMLFDAVNHGKTWTNSTFGVSEIFLYPMGFCTCSQLDVVDPENAKEYLKSGSFSEKHLENTLFDHDAPENQNEKKKYYISWDHHMATKTETFLMERTPAISFDFVQYRQIPDDMSWSDLNLTEVYINLNEKHLLRIVVGPTKINICSGLFHRISSLQAAAATYDYQPYTKSDPPRLLQDLQPPSEDDFEALNERITMKVIQITAIAPVIELELMDHHYFKATKDNYFKPRKRLSFGSSIHNLAKELPKLTLECQCLDAKFTTPLYADKVVATTCQLPHPPEQMFNACHNEVSIKIVGLCSRLILEQNYKYTTLIMPTNVTYYSKTIINPEYWLNNDVKYRTVKFESDAITITGTFPKLTVAYHILDKLQKRKTDESYSYILNSSLFEDAAKDFSMPYLEFCLEGINYNMIKSKTTRAFEIKIGSVKSFIFNPVDIPLDSWSSDLTVFGTNQYATREIEQIMFISNSGGGSKDSDDIFTAIIQVPLSPTECPHPPVIIFNIREIKICFDPLFCKWLLYTPTITLHKAELTAESYQRKLRNPSDISMLDTPRKLSTPQESIHSNSDREQILRTNQQELIDKEEHSIDIQERIYVFLKSWFNVWKGLILCGEQRKCIIYFPIQSLSAVGSKGIDETINQAIRSENPPEILVITLPNSSIKSNIPRKSVEVYLKQLPIKVPKNLWNKRMYSFPWIVSINNMSIYTLQYGKKLNVLKQVSMSSTVVLTTNSSEISEEKTNIKISHDSILSDQSIEIESLGLCIHIDISPIKMYFSESQVYLLSSILYGLTEVIFNRMSPVMADQKHKDLASPHVTLPPSLFCDNSMESTSENGTVENPTGSKDDKETQKLTAWIQSTITKLNITLLAHTHQSFERALYKELPDLKLVLDAEDIVSSVDFQNVYLKLKSKIGSATIQHYRRKTFEPIFVKGPFLGIIMRSREETRIPDKQDDTCFANITITRANCKHTHNLWGTLKKNKKSSVTVSNEMPSRFITEIVFTLQPIDFILSPDVVQDFLLVFQPLTQIANTLKKPKKKYEHKFKINNTTLPLTYIELKGFRFVFPTFCATTVHDMCILQIDNIILNPNPDNPICRTPVRPDIYEKAAQARLLHIPGSDIEDRQYQLELNGVSLNTGKWKEYEKVLKNIHFGTNLKTMSENPALEWNNLGAHHHLIHSPHLRLWPILGNFNTLLIAAPAMIYKNTLVCNHSIEINFVTDIDLNVSLSHVSLISVLLNELKYTFKRFSANNNFHPQVVFPYQSFYFLPATIFDDAESLDSKDSGFNTVDVKSNTSIKDNFVDSSRVHILSETDKLIRVVSRPLLLTHTEPKVAMEVLITAGKVSLIISQLFQDDLQTSSKHLMPPESNTLGLHLEPILYLSLSQPNCYISDTRSGKRMQVTCFDVSIKINPPNFKPITTIPTEDDFHINVLDTRPGAPDPDTGISPALFTVKLTKTIAKILSLDITCSKPMKLLFSVDRCEYLISTYEKLLETVVRRSSVVEGEEEEEIVEEPAATLLTQEIKNNRRLRFYDQYERFKEIKHNLRGISLVTIAITQLIIAVKTSDDIEITLSVGDLSHCVTINNRPERVIASLKFDYLTLGIRNGNKKKLVLNPWSLAAEVCLFWEPWQDEDSDPQIQVSIESDIITIDISPNHIETIYTLTEEITLFLNRYFTGTFKINPPIKTCIQESNQYYKDDLRAGAFQFVDAQSNNLDELPLPYQVMFWSRNASAMAWRYPQPRVLTKVRIFPVPFKVTTDEATAEQILCHLEYYSESYSSYQPFAQFYLSESEMCHLELPITEPKPIVACCWRVLLTSEITKDNSKQRNSRRVPISPHVLAGCIRIDSYFSKSLVPDLIAVINISSINISLYSNINKDEFYMPGCLKEYNCDLTLPENQCFLTLHINNIKAYLSSWNFRSIMFDTISDIDCSILDYAFLTNQTLIEPFSCKFTLSLSNKIAATFVSKPIRVRFGASAAHTLFVSAQLWNEKWNSLNVGKELVIVTPYVICNNCNIPLRFGQTGYEEIYLPTRYCHLYAWRSQKCKKMIRVAFEDDNLWVWSEPFRIDKEGTHLLKLGDQNMVIIVTVRALSATQYQVVFTGQLFIHNMLVEHFEFKVVEAVNINKDNAFKNANNYIINGKSAPPTILLRAKKKYFLRLRFFGLESAWSGDIPLAENTKSTQPWLVKVPLQERGQFLSIWCKVIVQQFPKGNKILAMLWPLFMIKSNLPVNSKIQIETPTLNVHLESTIRGKGEYQQLYCPGTIDHSHQLTLHLEGSTPSLNPYVPLNYSLVDHRVFFKRLDTVNIEEIIKTLQNFDNSDWPYFDENLDSSLYTVTNQPLTHVQVKYENACEYSSTLLVQLLPWCLLLNTLGCQIGIIINAKEICRVEHYGIVAPPKLEETFHIGVGLGKTWNMSLPLQLAKSDWGQSFYMPKITGTIPLEGNITTAVKCGQYFCILSLMGYVKNEIRLLKICSTHVITNHLNTEIHAVAFIVSNMTEIYHIPSNLNKHSFIIDRESHKNNMGTSITQWLTIGKRKDFVETQSEYALYVALSACPSVGWSCPVRVDQNLMRRSITVATNSTTTIPVVITSNELEGQIFLSLHHDKHPQMQIQNFSGIKLFFAQCSTLDNTIIRDCEHFKWFCSVNNTNSAFYTLPLYSQKFPEIQTASSNDHLVIASDPEGDPQGFQWSQPINLTLTEQFVRIPFFGDVKISTKHNTHTITLKIESISEAEINAHDIRVRLSQHETEIINTKSCDSIGAAQSLEILKTRATESHSSSTLASSYYTATETSDDVSFHVILQKYQHLNDSDIVLHLSSDFNSDKSPMSLDAFPESNEMKISVFLQSIIFTLTSDLENGGVERTEIITLTCDEIAFQLHQKEISDISIVVNKMQLDNQMYQSGAYDFSVILLGQEVRENESEISIHTPLQKLFHKARENPLIKIYMNYETWRDHALHKNIKDFKDIKIRIMPIAAYIEDVYAIELIAHLINIVPASVVIWPRLKRHKIALKKSLVKIPEDIMIVSSIMANPLIISSLCIEPLVLSLSVHSSKKMYIALDQSPLNFSQFERKAILTTSYRLGHTLTMHYLSGAIFGAGWVVGSLELLGSPGGFARAMGTGIRDFVSMPCYGLFQGPWAFVKGITHGSASLMKHFTSGTLHSVTKLASSVARNLDRLTLDEEHLRRTEEQRRQRPQGVTEGFLQGLTGLGISLLGAIGGIAHHPLQSIVSNGPSTSNLISGVGLGLVGIFTKPLSGAADLVALTGQGLLQGAGWNTLPQPRMNPISIHIYSSPNTLLKYSWKYALSTSTNDIIFATEATGISNGQYESIALILTLEHLVIANIDEDMPQRTLKLSELRSPDVNIDPTLLILKLKLPVIEDKREVNDDDDDLIVEMDPSQRARVADYVRSTVGLLHFPEHLDDRSDESLIRPFNLNDTTEQILTFYVSPQNRNFFLCLLEICKQQQMNHNFPIF